eukprot:4479680-Alexandrium_andersonii.AAC.1
MPGRRGAGREAPRRGAGPPRAQAQSTGRSEEGQWKLGQAWARQSRLSRSAPRSGCCAPWSSGTQSQAPSISTLL